MAARPRRRREGPRGAVPAAELTALRQLVDFALRELHKREALEAYRAGRVTLREFARTLGLDIWDAHDLLRAEGVPVAQGERSETRAALNAALDDPGFTARAQ